MDKLNLGGWENPVILAQVQLAHQRTVVSDVLIELVRTEAQREEAQYPEWGEISNGISQWALSELFHYGVLSLYHLWERYLPSILGVPNRQLGGKGGLVQAVADHLKKTYSLSLPHEVQTGLEVGRRMVNAMKHGEEAYDELKRIAPTLVEADQIGEDLVIEQDQFESLYRAIDAFYDFLEANGDHDFSKAEEQP